MIDSGFDQDFVLAKQKYLNMGVVHPLKYFLGKNSPYWETAWINNQQSQDNFLEGWLTKVYLLLPQMGPVKKYHQHMTTGFGRQSNRRTASDHTQIVDKQKVEGRKMVQYDGIIRRVEELMCKDTKDLLPQHQNFLEVDFSQLGDGSVLHRKYWIVSMESALKAADQAKYQSELCVSSIEPMLAVPECLVRVRRHKHCVSRRGRNMKEIVQQTFSSKDKHVPEQKDLVFY